MTHGGDDEKETACTKAKTYEAPQGAYAFGRSVAWVPRGVVPIWGHSIADPPAPVRIELFQFAERTEWCAMFGAKHPEGKPLTPKEARLLKAIFTPVEDSPNGGWAMKQVVVFPRGQLSAQDRRALARSGVCVVEADDPSKVVMVLPIASVISANDIVTAALHALSQPVNQNEHFVKKLAEFAMAAR